MSASTLSPHVVASPTTLSLQPLNARDSGDCLSFIDAARRSLDAYRSLPADASLRKQLAENLRTASAAVTCLPRKNLQDPAIAAALELVRIISDAGLAGGLFEKECNQIVLDARAQKSWPGLIARMLLQAPWQSPTAPLFSDIPDWLWGDFAAWVFTGPQFFHEQSEVDAFASHTVRYMEELAHWVSRNLGSPAVRAARQSYLTNFSFLPLTVSEIDLRRHAELHARILTSGVRINSSSTAVTGGRAGRALRVAFVASTPAAIPEFTRLLDSERFEVSLYVLEGAAEANGGESDAASVAILSLLRSGNRTRQYQALSAGLADQLGELQTAGLDIVVFTEELTASNGRLHQLASHRLAPLHVFTGAEVSTGLPTSDLFVITAAEALDADSVSEFSERVAVRQGCHLAFRDMAAPGQSRAETRANLGIPEKAFVMMTAARSIEISPSDQKCWVDLLCQLPGSYLAIQLLHIEAMPAGAIERFAAEWDSLLERASVRSDRLLILGGAMESLSDLQSVMTAADVFLDSSAFAEPDLLNVPLSLHIPIVTKEGSTFRSRRGAGLLRSLDLHSLIARDDVQLRRIVEQLATQPDELSSITTRLRELTKRLPLCRDQLAVAESLSSVLEDAYDDLHAKGAREFRSGRSLTGSIREAFSITETLQKAEEALLNQDNAGALEHVRQVFRVAPAHSRARSIVGRASMGLGQFARAVDYLLAAVQASDDEGLWFELAVALYRNDQRPQAVEALETCLRIDASHTDAWAMLVELANELGAHDIAADALGVFSQLAPDDPRIAGLSHRTQHS